LFYHLYLTSGEFAMNALNEKLTKIIKGMFVGTVFHLIDIKSSVSKRFTTLVIYIDREDGFFSHQDCVDWSAKFQDYIDRKELINGDYRLEISSPGIGRPLKEQWEFKKNLEKEIKVVFFTNENERKELIGTLINTDDEGIKLSRKDGSCDIPWSKLYSVKVQTPW
jgi:ribosome maturation factor RimP